ncbi:MAG: hypothetical protein SNJ83_02605 [Aggregatilineales bacterium]
MNLGRRKKPAAPQAVPAPAPSAAPPPTERRQNPIVKYLTDSYNGIYKILLEPNMPSKTTVALLVVGLLLGLLWGYGLAPIEFAGANPHRLNQSARDQWVLMAAGNFDRLFYDEAETARLLAQIEDPAGTVARLLQSESLTPSDREALLRIQPIAQNVVGTPAPADPGFFGNLLSGLIIPLLIVLIGTPIVVVVWRLFIYGNVVAPIVQRVREIRDPDLRARNEANRAELKRLKQQRAELDRIKSERTADEELGEPVVQLLKVYQSGRAYDESNEIEVGDEFLGQCGSVIPDLLNGDPLAIEVWLFDMQATQEKNFKKMFLTPIAANDPQLVSRLMADSGIGPQDLAVMQPGAKLILEGETLRVANEISTIEFNPNGRLTNFKMKVTAWRKQSAGGLPAYPAMPAAAVPAPVAMPSPAPAPAPQPPSYGGFGAAPRPLASPPPQPQPTPLRPLSDYDNIAFDPPPVPPARPQPSTFGAPAAPSFPPPEDDDPFGNTGDFTPLPPRR